MMKFVEIERRGRAKLQGRSEKASKRAGSWNQLRSKDYTAKRKKNISYKIDSK